MTKTSAKSNGASSAGHATTSNGSSTIAAPSPKVAASNANAAPSSNKSKGSLWNVSTGATVVMALYIGMAMYNVYHLMYPLRLIDLNKLSNKYPDDYVHPLWKSSSNGNGADSATSMHLRVYLSTQARFSFQFLSADDRSKRIVDEPIKEISSSVEQTVTPAKRRLVVDAQTPHILVWDQELNHPTLSASFLLTSIGTNDDDDASHDDENAASAKRDASYAYALDWLNRTERSLLDMSDGGILATLSAGSGHGIESTSVLLTLYDSMARRASAALTYISSLWRPKQSPIPDANSNQDSAHGFVGRTTIHIPKASPIWKRLQSNSTVFVHVLVVRLAAAVTNSDGEQVAEAAWPPTSREATEKVIRTASQTNSLLMGQVNMIKYDLPNHVPKPRRLLYRDILYYWNRYILGSKEMPPWEMAIYKPLEYAAYRSSTEMKIKGMGYPYWKPEVSIKYVSDEDSYPIDYAHMSGMPIVDVSRQQQRNDHPTGLAFIPALHVDEMGMTSEKYIPVNGTVSALPLRISFDRSDWEHVHSRTGTTTATPRTSTTATTGGISPARWRLLSHLSSAIEKQKSLGFDESDIDEIKRLIAETNITLLSITMLASALHLLFEFLTFKSEVSFWNKNNDLTGLSVRSLFLDLIGQTIILFYLIEKESSLLTTIPSAIGCLIALWKVRRAAGLQFVKASSSNGADEGSRSRHRHSVAWWNWIPLALTGYELRATRWEASTRTMTSENGDDSKIKNSRVQSKDRLIAMTIEADRMATRYLGAVLLPLASGYTIYSLIYNEHRSWYSWLITSAASAVYALGFVLMTPQLFLNYKLQSVAHLPWRVLVYKSLNTFIDDLFSFIIRMPTMARLSCFRDDVVFFIYLYQRWLYPVDASRPVEGGGEGEPTVDSNNSVLTNETKKIQ